MNTREKTQTIFNFKNSKQEILLFGCQHSYNPQDKKFKKIKKLFEKFLKDKNIKNIEVALEQFTPSKNINLAESIKKFDNTGFVAYLAKQKKLKTFCPEPNQKQILDFVLKKGYKKIDIIAWILLNIINFKIKNKRKLNGKDINEIKKIINKTMKQLKFKEKNIFPLVIKKINNVAKKNVLPNEFKKITNYKLASQTILKLQNPFSKKTIFNKIGANINLARDYFIAKQIFLHFKKGKNIFAVFGVNHIVVQKKYLEKFLKK